MLYLTRKTGESVIINDKAEKRAEAAGDEALAQVVGNRGPADPGQAQPKEGSEPSG